MQKKLTEITGGATTEQPKQFRHFFQLKIGKSDFDPKMTVPPNQTFGFQFLFGQFRLVLVPIAIRTPGLSPFQITTSIAQAAGMQLE